MGQVGMCALFHKNRSKFCCTFMMGLETHTRGCRGHTRVYLMSLGKGRLGYEVSGAGIVQRIQRPSD